MSHGVLIHNLMYSEFTETEFVLIVKINSIRRKESHLFPEGKHTNETLPMGHVLNFGYAQLLLRNFEPKSAFFWISLR